MLPPPTKKPNATSFPVDFNVLAMFGIFKQKSAMEITSFDGKPFLTPSQFGFLSYQQQNVLKESNKEKESQDAEAANTIVEETGKKRGRERELKGKKSLSDADFELENLESIQKKVKRENKMLSPSTQEEDISDTGRTLPETTIETPNIGSRENIKKNKRIVHTEYNKDLKKLMFKVESWSSNMNEKESIELTREEVLKEDVRMLLYFYENHLEFSKTPQFKPEKLKKL